MKKTTTTNILRHTIAAAATLTAGSSMALAEAAAPASAGEGLASFIPLILIMAIFYFLLIRPQQKRLKEHKQMVAELKKGDKVVTGGGIVGTVTDAKEGEDTIRVEIADGVKVQVRRETVAALSE